MSPSPKAYPTKRSSEKAFTQISHRKLVEVARRWLYEHHPLVITELATYGEIPDAIGWKADHHSTLIECKASRADFISDKGKWFRKYDENGLGMYRFFLTPPGVIKDQSEVPDRWGILEYKNGRVYRQRHASAFTAHNYAGEMRILISVIRRLGQTTPKGVSCKPYYLHTGERATVSMEIDDDV